MDTRFVDKVRSALNHDVAERLVLRYFMSKGFDKTSLDRLIYPPIMMDMGFALTEMSDKIEVVPYVASVDPMGDTAVLGWYLFVLGNHRCYLGESFHTNLKTLALQLQHGQVVAEDQMASRQTTPRRIIKFISTVLRSHDSGYVNLTPRIVPLQMGQAKPGGMGMARQFWQRTGG